MYHDEEYLGLVKYVLDEGVVKTDRTGTGTLSVFAQQMRFDLSNHSIPLLTTKKMHTRSIIHEILWYLQGTGSGKYLKDNNVRIWDEWMTPDNHLNYIYGYQWRRWETPENNTPTLIEERKNCGIDKPFTTIKQNLLETEKSNTRSDDIIGKYFIGRDGAEYRIIKRDSCDKNAQYLIQFTDSTTTLIKSRPSIIAGGITDPHSTTTVAGGCVGVICEKPSYYTVAYNLWYNMMRRCHDDTYLPEYVLYGGDGVYVDQSWRCFANFLHDIKYLSGFRRWAASPNKYALDKDYFGSKCYSKNTCVFLSNKYNQQLSNLNGDKIVGIRLEDGFKDESTIAKELTKRNNLSKSTIWNALNSNKSKTANGWRFEKISPPKGFVYRKQLYIDQIAKVIEQLKNSPDDRRIIVNAWNVADIDSMALPPCHTMFQFWSAELSAKQREDWMYKNVNTITCDGPISDEAIHAKCDKYNVPRRQLRCHLFQRSADCGLGIPYNIVQYSILTHMIAKVTNHIATEFVWTGGDVHIYNNHIEQLKGQLELPPYLSPSIHFNRDIESIDDFVYEDFEIDGYQSHPIIKMPVAV